MDFTFVIVGCIISLFFTLLTWKRLGSQARWALSVAAFFLLISMVTFKYPGAIYLDEDPSWHNRTPYRELILFLLMIGGMVARYFTIAIEERRERIRATSQKKIRLKFDLWEFSYPLFISVITFGILMEQIGDKAVSLADITLSFQTGFFWQTVLGSVRPISKE